MNFSSEEPIALREAASIIPGRPSVATLFRWATRGVHGVRLSTVRLGRRRFTSREAVERFVAATTAATTPPLPNGNGKHPPPKPKNRESAIAKAEAELATIKPRQKRRRKKNG